jgi:putative transposase
LKHETQFLTDEVPQGNDIGRHLSFAVVTHHWRSFLSEPQNVALLRRSFWYAMQRHPFVIDAAVILPEHLHCIWTLPDGDSDYSMRWRLIKSFFSRQCGDAVRGEISTSRKHKKEQAVWQRRFWEHCIRDEQDLRRHVEYIHYNPVRHGLVRAPKDWEYSSFHKYVREGKYDVL